MRASLAQGPGEQRLSILVREQIEDHVDRGGLRGEQLHARYRRINPLEQRIERKASAGPHGDFAIEHKTLCPAELRPP
jgi:hypothetical protein